MEQEQDYAERLRRGERAAFAQIYKEHLRDVMYLLHNGFGYTTQDGSRRFMRVKHAFDREDLCNEAFAQFFRQCIRGKFNPALPVRPYLRRIVMNLALRKLRDSARCVPVESPEPELRELPDPVEQQQAIALMGQFTQQLDEDEQQVLQGCVSERLSQRVVGERLGLSRDQVYRSLVKIRQSASVFFRKRGWFDGSS